MKDHWLPIRQELWQDTPCIKGRRATEEDVRNGAAVFYVSGETNPAAIPLPACAYQLLDDGTEEPVVVIQAETGPSGTIFGVRPLSGGNGICTEAELRFAPDGF